MARPEEVRTGSVDTVALTATVGLAPPGARARVPVQLGSGDILRHPLWSKAGMPHARVAAQ
jgi:hypothetical protein